MPVYTGLTINDYMDYRFSGTADTLDGGLGADTMLGGDGDDVYLVDNIGDVVEEFFFDSVAGYDWVIASVTYTLNINIEKLTLSGSSNINGTGNAIDNVISGNVGNNQLSGLGGNDTLDGGFGADTMDGGSGNDVYFVDNLFDITGETANDFLGGEDSVFATASHTLGFGIENLTLAGLLNINGTGNENNNVIIGNNGNNILNGGAGNDSIDGGAGDDDMFGGDNNDTITGSAGDDAFGEGGDDHLIHTFVDGGNTWDGGTGIDLIDFSFETFEDTWIMDLSAANFVIWSVTFQNFENVKGSQGNDTIIGSAVANVLDGGIGNDRLKGGLGSDTIDGGTGNDTADFSDKTSGVSLKLNPLGSFAKVGGVAEDFVKATENAAGGSGSDRFTGTALDNALTGNGGNDVLNGLGGTDVLSGGNGNDVMDGGTGTDRMEGGADDDIYFVDRTTDIVTEDNVGGFDTVYASTSYTLRERVFVEVLATISSVSIAPIDLTGNSRPNTIIGNDGDNTLSGKAGKDTLDGGGGEDSFVFDTALGVTNIDTLVNFSVVDDTIVLSSAIFGVLPAGVLSGAAFTSNLAALDDTDRIIYNAATNSLLYDEDGNGLSSAVTFAKLTGLSGVLTADDFIVV